MTGNPTENAENDTMDPSPRQVAQEYDFEAQHKFLSELVKKGIFEMLIKCPVFFSSR